MGDKAETCRIVSNIASTKIFLYGLCSSTCYGNLVSIELTMGKVKLWDLFLSHCIHVYRNVCWVVLHQTYHFSPNLSVWLVAMATERLNLREKKINSAETIRGIKLKLCIIVHNISLYKNIVFCYHCLSTLVAVATLNFLLPNIYFLSKPLNLIGFHSNQKAQFVKNIKKINSSEAVWGIKLKLCRNVHSISLFKNVFYCCFICTLVDMAT